MADDTGIIGIEYSLLSITNKKFDIKKLVCSHSEENLALLVLWDIQIISALITGKLILGHLSMYL